MSAPIMFGYYRWLERANGHARAMRLVREIFAQAHDRGFYDARVSCEIVAEHVDATNDHDSARHFIPGYQEEVTLTVKFR